MIRRPRRSTPSALVALVLLAACAFVAVVLIQRLIGERPWLSYETAASRVHATAWQDLPVLIGGGAAVVIGLLLLFAAILPGRPTVLPLVSGADHVDTGATRTSLRTSLRGAVASVDGVSSAKVKLGRKKVVAKVGTNRTTTDGMADAVREAVGKRLDEVAPLTRPRVRVRVSSAREPK
ncbi:DUF6286 domain-containing protein [Amycolatopsis sp. H20-H5]|uniref:DUF6286 domain-containing protein n=1 Tax=Amycolatopsis sp. H20-H5 TaxID=3046309 RepID=UPI002DB99E6B|nr:DUF6286 domain-containing protein [Amycolatopsis sp. H20-H5]MEC3975644.1 DUF6286 domain-containing protein [Amycolatopsis sp. H20-H5]